MRIPLVLCLLIAGFGSAETQQTISVSGGAEIKVPPDRVNLYLGVEVRSKDLGLARQKNDDLVKAVLAVPRRFGVTVDDVQTDFIQVEMEYELDGLTVKYYAVRKTINVLLRDISKFEGMLAAALDAGATHVHGVEFSTSQLRKHRDEARALAVKAAQEKAADLAAAAGRKAGPAQTISASYGGGSWYGYGWYGGGRHSRQQNVVQYASGGAGGAEPGSVSLGRISVTAAVGITFALE